MKIKIFFIAVLFFYLSSAMDNPHPKKRRTELEDLLGDAQILYRCESEGCPFVNTYKAVADHERRKHRMYRNPSIEKKEEQKPELFLCEFPQCTFYGVYGEVAAHEEKHNIDSPIKAHIGIPLLEALDKPEIPSYTHLLLTALDKTYFEHEKKEVEERINKQKKCWIARSYARAEKLSNRVHQCPNCPEHFKLRFEYIDHMFKEHNHMFPPYENKKAHHERIERYKNTPSKFVVID
jgi:uncharacterized C2H2 Zn-finger protein